MFRRLKSLKDTSPRTRDHVRVTVISRSATADAASHIIMALLNSRKWAYWGLKETKTDRVMPPPRTILIEKGLQGSD